MPLLSIVIVVIRLCGLIWLLDGVLRFLMAVTSVSIPAIAGIGTSMLAMLLYIGPTLLQPLVGAIIFKMAQPIARVVTPASAAELSPLSISPHLLYSFAFTFLGLWFALSSIGAAFNSFQFYFERAVTPANQFLPDINLASRSAASIVTFIAGLACLLCAPRLARKFATIQERYDGKANLPKEESAA